MSDYEQVILLLTAVVLLWIIGWGLVDYLDERRQR